MNLQPLGDRVIVRVPESKTKTESGLYIPQVAQTKGSVSGSVEAVGKDVTTLKVGDEVYYDKFAGVPIDTRDEHFLILRVEDILAVVAKDGQEEQSEL